MNNRFYIYGLFYEDEEGDNICFYIGKGTGKRYKTHTKESKLKTCSNNHKVNKIRKLRRNNKEIFGKIMVDDLTDEKALELEKSILKNNWVYENTTNIERGGRRGALCEETKKKISKKNSGKNNYFFGKTHSKETKEKISESLKGNKLKEKTKQKISDQLKEREISETHKKKIGEAQKGEKSHRSKISKREASEIKWLTRNSNKTQSQIGEEYGLTKPSVSRIKNGKSWSHVNPIKP